MGLRISETDSAQEMKMKQTDECKTSYPIIGACLRLSENLQRIIITLVNNEHCSISHHQQGRIDFNTVNPTLPTGKDFLIHSL